MRSGLNGRRINRLAVNATYREIIHAESTATLAVIDLLATADPAVYGNAEGAGIAEIEPLLVSEPAVLPITEPDASLAVIDFETMVSPLAIPYIPATYAYTPPARLMDLGHRESLELHGDPRELRVQNTRDEALEVEDGGREFEIADSRREIEVRRKRRLEP